MVWIIKESNRSYRKSILTVDRSHTHDSGAR